VTSDKGQVTSAALSPAEGWQVPSDKRCPEQRRRGTSEVS